MHQERQDVAINPQALLVLPLPAVELLLQQRAHTIGVDAGQLQPRRRARQFGGQLQCGADKQQGAITLVMIERDTEDRVEVKINN